MRKTNQPTNPTPGSAVQPDAIDKPIASGFVALARALNEAIAKKRGARRSGIECKCAVCAKPFKPNKVTQLYCSQSCKSKANQVNATAARARNAEQHREIVRQLREDPVRVRGTHWYFRTNNGTPTADVPTFKQPRGEHVRVAVVGNETPFEAMDRCIEGWGDKDTPAVRLRWRGGRVPA